MTTATVGKSVKTWIENHRVKVWQAEKVSATFTSTQIAADIADEFPELSPSLLISRIATTLVNLRNDRKIVKAKKDVDPVIGQNNRKIIVWRTNRRIDLERPAKISTPNLNSVFNGNEPVDVAFEEVHEAPKTEVVSALKETVANLPSVIENGSKETYLEILGAIIDLTTKLTDPDILLATFSDKELAAEQLRRAENREIKK